jgi:Peptidase family M28
VVDLRLYRMAFAPLALAVVYVAFSLATWPPALTTTLPPTAFVGSAAMTTLETLAKAYPDRRPGSAGDQQLAAYMAAAFKRDGFATRTNTFTGDTVDGRKNLETVIASRQGASSPSIVIVAHRDSARPGSLAELSGSAALLELAHVFSETTTNRALTLVSTTGGSGGAAGAADLAAHLPGPVDAVIVLGDLAGARSSRPYVIPWSDGSQIAPIQLRRTVEGALQTQLGRSPGGAAVSDQVARLVFPLTVGEQGPLDAAGIPAVLIQQSGEVGPSAGDPVPPSATRFQEFGRGVLGAVDALDNGPTVGPPTRDLLLGHLVLKGSLVRLLVGLLILPALVAAVDALARARRRNAPLGGSLVWLAVAGVPFLLAALFAVVLGRSDLLSAAPTGPVTSRQLPSGASGTIALISVALVFGLAWLLRAPLVRRLAPGASPSAAGAPVALVLVASAIACVVWVFNPYAALLTLLPLHLWLFATMLERPPPKAMSVALVGVSLIPLAALMLLDAGRLGLGPHAFAWTGLLMVAGAHVGLGPIVLWSLSGGCLIGAFAVAVTRAREHYEDLPPITVRGPVSYAGPGSLGGTDSALRR